MFGLVLAYPLLTHAAVWLQQPLLQWGALTVLVAISLYDALKKAALWAWLTLALASGGLFALVRMGGGMYALYLPPIILPAALLVLFARSLRAGSVPLITRYAEAMRGPLPEDLARYTANVTRLWVGIFAAMASSAALLATFASHEIWSIATNFVHYLVLGAAFLLEYLYRLYKFRHLSHPSFLAYLRMLFKTRVRTL